MQLKFINYLHYASKFCAGYDAYLEKRKAGTIAVFNWNYFILSFTWLIYHRMYKEFIVFTYYVFFISFLLEKEMITKNTCNIILITSHILISFFTYKIYENHLNMKLQVGLKDVYKKIKPFNFFLSLVLTIFGIFFVMTIYQITLIYIIKAFSIL